MVAPAPTRGRRTRSAGPDLEGVIVTVPRSVSELAEPLTADSAHARVASSALTDSVLGSVGLEVETHLVDLEAVTRPSRLGRDRRRTSRADGIRPRSSSVTVEPGGQIELSGPPAADVSEAAIADARRRPARSPEVTAVPTWAGSCRRRPASPGSTRQPESAVPGDGGAFRRDRPCPAWAGNDEFDRGPAGERAGRSTGRMGCPGGPCPPSRPDLDRDLSLFALAGRPRHRMAVGTAARSWGDLDAGMRPGGRHRRAGRRMGALRDARTCRVCWPRCRRGRGPVPPSRSPLGSPARPRCMAVHPRPPTSTGT